MAGAAPRNPKAPAPAQVNDPEKNPFLAAALRYAFDAELFVREVLGQDPDVWQAEVLAEYSKKRGTRLLAIKSGHRVGKTTVLAWIIIHHQLFNADQKSVVTAASQDQLFDALAAETKTWIGKLPAAWQQLLHVTHDRIELKAAPSANFVSFRVSRADKPEALAGVHSPGSVLLIADEASGVPDAIFESATGSLGNPNVCFILAGNPVRSSGFFFDVHTKPELGKLWRRWTVSSVDIPRVSRTLIAQIKAKYGERSNAYRVRVLGEFPVADDDTVIPYEYAASAMQRDVHPIDVKSVWGVDVARFGDDASALARRKGNTLTRKTEVRYALDLMQVVGWIKMEWDLTPLPERPAEIIVDAIGYGAGVADRLAELGLPVRALNVSESPAIWSNGWRLRDDLWFKGREWFARRDCNLQNDEDLLSELISVKYQIVDSSGKYKVESKKEMKKRGLPSPNRADAFLLTLASDAATAAAGSAGRKRTDWNVPLKREIKGIV